MINKYTKDSKEDTNAGMNSKRKQTQMNEIKMKTKRGPVVQWADRIAFKKRQTEMKTEKRVQMPG